MTLEQAFEEAWNRLGDGIYEPEDKAIAWLFYIAALEKYGRHDRTCSAGGFWKNLSGYDPRWIEGDGPCTCDLEQALKGE